MSDAASDVDIPAEFITFKYPLPHFAAALLGKDPPGIVAMNNGYKGYLEDRRPNSQGDPYQIASQILKTISEVPTAAKSAAA